MYFRTVRIQRPLWGGYHKCVPSFSENEGCAEEAQCGTGMLCVNGYCRRIGSMTGGDDLQICTNRHCIPYAIDNLYSLTTCQTQQFYYLRRVITSVTTDVQQAIY
jgi:hypothetical protein